MKAMIFAAGLGTRLKPLTDTMPKALVPVSGRPLIDYVIEKVRSAGIGDITVNVHHFADMIVSHLEGSGVHISDERDLLRETGGGILHASRFLRGEGPFLVHNVDILSNLDISRFVADARKDALANLVVSERVSGRYLLFDEDMRLQGWTNVKTGEVRSPYPGLDPDRCRRLAFSGIHLLSEDVLDIMEDGELPEKFSIIDFYLSIAGKYPVYGYVPADFRMLDVGKTDSLQAAADFIAASSL